MRPRTIRQLTLRGFEPELEKHIRDLAEREDLSLNQAVMKVLRRGAELLDEASRPHLDESVRQLFGRWTKEEADEFDAFMKDFEQIDASFWK